MQHTANPGGAGAAATAAAAGAGGSTPPPHFSPMPAWGEYESYTGGGGRTADGLVRQCTMLKCRSDPELMAGYKEWHGKVFTTPTPGRRPCRVANGPGPRGPP